jgi:antitoxin protein of toxin-antitoxin system
MGISDKLGDMASDAVKKAGGPEKAKGHISKAAGAADRATHGKYGEQIDKGEAGAKSAVNKLSKKNKRK